MVDFVYVIYDACITSIVGIFKTKKEADKAISLNENKNMYAIIKFKCGKIYEDGINESSLTSGVNYMTH